MPKSIPKGLTAEHVLLAIYRRTRGYVPPGALSVTCEPEAVRYRARVGG